MSSANPPVFGKYVKHIDTRVIIECICYDPETELLLTCWPTGAFCLVPRRGVTRITPNEESELQLSQGKALNRLVRLKPSWGYGWNFDEVEI